MAVHVLIRAEAQVGRAGDQDSLFVRCARIAASTCCVMRDQWLRLSMARARCFDATESSEGGVSGTSSTQAWWSMGRAPNWLQKLQYEL